jgi:TPR repeat protein
LTCKLCEWLCKWFCPEAEQSNASFWEESRVWEKSHSNESELWAATSDSNRELVDQAIALWDSDRQAAFEIYLEAAEAGCIWAMEIVGWHYDTGTVVTADFGQAQEYYYRALCAGSWMATIKYARLLAAHGHYDYCERVLEDGVRSDFIPAFFWLAWFRYKQSKRRKTCPAIRPMLEYAAEQGHPGAHWLLMRLRLQGKLGLREILSALREILDGSHRRSHPEAGAAVGS